MNLHSTIELRRRAKSKKKTVKSASSLIGRRYKTQDTFDKNYINEFDNPEDAEKSAAGRPYTRVVSIQNPAYTQKLKDMARQRLVKTNPDVD